MSEYTVKQLSELAGVSIRTLHHYDEIGLLKPRARTVGDYRIYGEQELLRLQQILLYRELDIPLAEIRSILDAPGFDTLNALQEHQARLQMRLDRLHRLLETVDETIKHIRGANTMSDRNLYEGFPRETGERYRREARNLYGTERVEQMERRVQKLGDKAWDAVKQEGEDIACLLAEVMDQPPDSDAAQEIIRRHHEWIENFYPAPAELYRGLGELYAGNPEFRSFHDRHREGLADYFCAAMRHYADTVLTT
ncbi:MAG: MerR family transcriptional regulator [Proteobacteria bacterium]|nr:MerR family transcriptional regulator [Pseudomonadota bacterium]